jgi:hypothetical protein
MFSWFYLHFLDQTLSCNQRLLKRALVVMLLLVLSAGCSEIRSPAQFFQLPGHVADVDLNLHVTPANTPGTYQVTGKTNLPERTQLTVAAVRYLYPATPVGKMLNPEPTYGILDYQSVQVSQGQWQTQLNLWQVAPNGQFKEGWQIDQSRLGVSLKPTEEVVFLATLAPVGKLPKLEQQLARQGMRLASGTVRSTSDGQRYAQVNQMLAIALPTGSTTPPSLQAEDVNQGWGYRYLIPQEPQNPTKLEFPDTRNTNAPASPKEFLQ